MTSYFQGTSYGLTYSIFGSEMHWRERDLLLRVSENHRAGEIGARPSSGPSRFRTATGRCLWVCMATWNLVE